MTDISAGILLENLAIVKRVIIHIKNIDWEKFETFLQYVKFDLKTYSSILALSLRCKTQKKNEWCILLSQLLQ